MLNISLFYHQNEPLFPYDIFISKKRYISKNYLFHILKLREKKSRLPKRKPSFIVIVI